MMQYCCFPPIYQMHQLLYHIYYVFDHHFYFLQSTPQLFAFFHIIIELWFAILVFVFFSAFFDLLTMFFVFFFSWFCLFFSSSSSTTSTTSTSLSTSIASP